MGLRVYNSLSREKEDFIPINEGRVHIYVCGPTVYNDAHLGHGKTYVNFDTIVRYLRYKYGEKNVRYVQNITDVGHLLADGTDRIARGARREQVEPMELVEYYTRRYFEDMDALNILRPDISPRASGHIIEQIELVKSLLDKGYAYEVNDSVYFDVSKYPDYGKLAGRNVEDMQAGARGDTRDEKRHPADFALWKRAEPEHIMRWPSPWGEGFPGWHIECTAMSVKYLGVPFDIHGGGMDNKFPHHECEIAQSEAAFDQPFAKYWLHNGMLNIGGEKMSKSLGNFVTLRKAEETYSPLAIRFFVLGGHYRAPLDLTEEAITAAQSGLERLHGAVRAVRARLLDAPEGELDAEMQNVLDKQKQAFIESMDDDFNTPGGVAALFDLTREVNTWLAADDGHLNKTTLTAIDGLYRELGEDVLGIIPDPLPEEDIGELTAPLIELLITTRQDLRSAKQWALADKIRDELGELGVALEDTKEGTEWRIRRRS